MKTCFFFFSFLRISRKWWNRQYINRSTTQRTPMCFYTSVDWLILLVSNQYFLFKIKTNIFSKLSTIFYTIAIKKRVPSRCPCTLINSHCYINGIYPHINITKCSLEEKKITLLKKFLTFSTFSNYFFSFFSNFCGFGFIIYLNVKSCNKQLSRSKAFIKLEKRMTTKNKTKWKNLD